MFAALLALAPAGVLRKAAHGLSTSCTYAPAKSGPSCNLGLSMNFLAKRKEDWRMARKPVVDIVSHQPGLAEFPAWGTEIGSNEEWKVWKGLLPRVCRYFDHMTKVSHSPCHPAFP